MKNNREERLLFHLVGGATEPSVIDRTAVPEEALDVKPGILLRLSFLLPLALCLVALWHDRLLIPLLRRYHLSVGVPSLPH